MGRVIRRVFLLCLIVLLAYQHITIHRVTQQTASMIRQMEVEYDKRVGELQKLMAEKGTIEQELAQAEAELEAIDQVLHQAREEEIGLANPSRPLVDRIGTLVENRRALAVKVAFLTSEKETLERKFQDRTELKRALKDARRKQKERKQSFIRLRDKQLLAAGNKGFLVHEGRSTQHHQGTVQVIPAPLPALAKDGQI
ncbi:MAG: hypothetical protein HYS56_05515 [Candidatus Omnitrophica bacterium]|nr:hypothetical protein [Candidatus Omnitrophota bacterium]